LPAAAVSSPISFEAWAIRGGGCDRPVGASGGGVSSFGHRMNKTIAKLGRRLALE